MNHKYPTMNTRMQVYVDAEDGTTLVAGQRINGRTHNVLCRLNGTSPMDVAHAERIAMCWNCHDELLEIVRFVDAWCQEGGGPIHPGSLIDSTTTIKKAARKAMEAIAFMNEGVA